MSPNDTISIQFKTQNAAFEGENYTDEVKRILKVIGDRIEDGDDEGVIRDINGNSVGAWTKG